VKKLSNLDVSVLASALAERLDVTPAEAVRRIGRLRVGLPPPLGNDLNLPWLLKVWLENSLQVQKPVAGGASIWRTLDALLR